MVDKTAMMFRGGIRSAKKTLADGNEHMLFYRAKTPNELAAHFGAEASFANDEAGSVARQKHRAKFISTSMCDEGGAPLMSAGEAENILGGLKQEICNMIVLGSNEVGDAGKG